MADINNYEINSSIGGNLQWLSDTDESTAGRLVADKQEGQLSVDVLETAEELVVVATMAGTRSEDIELHLHNDFLTIRGRRIAPVPGAAHYFYEECFWGPFSRTIVLPVDVKADLAQSEYKNGVLTIRLPKASLLSTIPILVVED